MLYQPSSAEGSSSSSSGGGDGLVSRHQTLPLRVSQGDLNRLVEALPLKCTHYDAFRFFAPPAAPLNGVEPAPSRASQPQLEQPGCVHASMDLFRFTR